MPVSLLVALAWRNLVRNVRRSLFGVTIIAFGVSGLALAGGFINDVFEQLSEVTISAQLGHVQVAKAGFWESGTGRPNEFLIRDPNLLKRQLASDPRVADVMGRLSFSGLAAYRGAELAVEVEGVEPAPEARLGGRLIMLSGRNLRDEDRAMAVLGEGVAKRLRAGVGTGVSLTAPTIDGSINLVDVEVVGVFRSFSKEFDDRAIRIALPIALELVQADAVNTIVVRLGQTSDTVAAFESISSRLGSGEFEVRTWEELSDFYSSTKAMYAKQFGFLTIIALVLVVMSVLNSLNMTVFERTAEFGTMRVLGNRSWDVFVLIVCEAVLLGVIGTMAGLILASLLAAGISQVGIPMPPPPNMEAGYTARILLTPATMLQASVVGICSAAIAALLPAARLLRVPLVDALRRAV